MEREPRIRRSPWDDGSSLKAEDGSFDDAGFFRAYPDWVIKQNISYRSATHEDTRRIFARTRSGLEKLMYKSHTSLSNFIVDAYDRRHLEIRDVLLTTKSQITISCDAWTSTNNLSLLGVVAHFVGWNNKRYSTLLALPRLFGSHDGRNLADTLCTIISKYEIGQKIHCFMMDNASNNDAMMDHLCRRIPTLQRRARLRCSGHIFNLIVKAILYGKGVSKFEQHLLGCGDREDFDLWRRCGAIGKVHNFVKYVCRSCQRREKLTSYQAEAAVEDELFDWHEKLLIKDGGVRWNSTCMMLQRAKQLRRAIELFQKDNDEPDEDEDCGYSVSKDRITRDDWDEIDRFLDLLEPILMVTKELEGNPGISTYGSLWAVFPSLNILSVSLQEAIDDVKAEPESYYKSGVIMGKQKLDKYWDRMTTESPFYFAATILHPSLKLAYFKDKWRKFPDWQKRAEQSMEKFYKEYVTDAQVAESDVSYELSNRPLASSLLPNKPLRAHLRVDEQYSLHGRSTKRRKIESELNEYYRDGLVDLDEIGDEPLQWWIEQSDNLRNPYPTLTKMAFDLFSIPAMSAECERVFSQAAKVVTDERNRRKEPAYCKDD